MHVASPTVGWWGGGAWVLAVGIGPSAARPGPAVAGTAARPAGVARTVKQSISSIKI